MGVQVPPRPPKVFYLNFRHRAWFARFTDFLQTEPAEFNSEVLAPNQLRRSIRGTDELRVLRQEAQEVHILKVRSRTNEFV